MLVILPLALFVIWTILFWCWLTQVPGETPGWREAFLPASIVLGVIIAVSSEALSLFNAIQPLAVVFVWLATLVVSLILMRHHGGLAQQRVKAYRETFHLRGMSKPDQLMLLVLSLFSSLLFVVARLAPPNTNDSLSYHMSRVMHWMQAQSLDHFPTAIDRQLWMPPWAEMTITQLYLFKGDDGFSNLVQWFSMVACLVVVSLIAKRLGASTTGQLFAALFCVTIPMGLLQATSTQTDYVTALWLVALAYYALLAHQRGLIMLEWLLVSLVVGLGVMTKGTFYIFALPFLVWLLVSTLRRTGVLPAIKYALLGLLIVAFLNAGVWSRNYQTYGFPLGPSDSIGYLSNEAITPATLLSNLLRNSTLHLGTAYGVVNGPMTAVVSKFHQLIGLDLDDPRITLDEYRIKRYLHEDRAGNPLHFLLIPLTGLALLKTRTGFKGHHQVWVFALAVCSTFLLFSAVYKWQSTGSRLLLPFFVSWAPLAGLAMGKPKYKRPAYLVGLVLVIAGIQPLLSNPSRALIPFSPEFANLHGSSRSELLFANSPEVMPAYLALASDIANSDCAQVGIKLRSSDVEYPLWYLLVSEGLDPQIKHIDVPSPSGKYLDESFQPCAIVCTTCDRDSLHGLPLKAVYQGTYFLYLSAATVEN